MPRTIHSLQCAAFVATLCSLANPAAAQPGGQAARMAAASTQQSLSTASTSQSSGAILAGGSGDDEEVCFCEATYSNGTTEEVPACSYDECPDLERYLACQDVAITRAMPIGGCRLLERCECDCRSTELVRNEYYDSDVYLAGVPNLWQFDYRCGAFGTNAVGCGPVSASMVMYWWAQQGYDGLVDGFLSGAGSSPADREHDWQAMVETFRDDYLDGGICVSDQYATLQGTLRDGIDEYIADAGYSASVGHYKVCDDCNRNESDEISASAGLDIIVDELRAGRPVIMGFNVGRAMDESQTFEADIATFGGYGGELSNGTPVTGIISHYAVITGYARADGQDVLILNLGWEGWEDVAFRWNPAGKWLHLYTIDLHGAPDGDDFCAIDRGLDATFLASADLDLSFDWSIIPETALAGTYCGILREVIVSEYYPSWSGTTFECDPFGRLEQDIAEAGLPWGSESTDPRSGPQSGAGGLIRDQELPLP